MFRKSTLYRRLWYVRKRNIKRIHLMLRLALAAMILWVVFLLTQRDMLSVFGL